MDSMIHEEMREVLNRIVFHTTEKMAGMQIRSHPHHLSDDLCCVSTKFEGTRDLTLILCADRLFFKHLAQELFQDPDVTEDDVSEAAREYLNVICGRLVGQVSSLIHRPASFHLPVFHNTYYIPDTGMECCCKSQYINEDNEGLMLILTLSPPKSENHLNRKCTPDHLRNINHIKGAV